MPDEVMRRGDFDVVNALFAKEYVLHDLRVAQDFKGLDGCKEYVTLVRRSLPDVLMAAHYQEVEDGRLVTHYTVRGTQWGELFGVARFGDPVSIAGTLVTRFAKGRITEQWNQYEVGPREEPNTP